MKKNEQVSEVRENKRVMIEAPNFRMAEFRAVGTAPLVMNKFSRKAREIMAAKQASGSQAKKGAKREGKDFESCYEGAFHRSREGWAGIPASAFRAAMVSACRLIGFKMTIAKMALFVLADGFDEDDGTPLVRIEGEPRKLEMAVRNETGVVDIRVRPIWEAWEVRLQVRYDADMFDLESLTNLLSRAGLQVGVGEGRPDSKRSCGMGWGMFDLKPVERKAKD